MNIDDNHQNIILTAYLTMLIEPSPMTKETATSELAGRDWWSKSSKLYRLNLKTNNK